MTTKKKRPPKMEPCDQCHKDTIARDMCQVSFGRRRYLYCQPCARGTLGLSPKEET